MATTNLMITALCLSLMVCASVSQRYYPDYGHGGYRPYGPYSPSARLTQSCSVFTREKMQQPSEFRGRCTSSVLDKVYDLDEDIYKDNYMKNLFRQARSGMLCYAEGTHVREVINGCDAMEISCSRFTPKKIDTCWKIVEEVKPPPPAQPPVTTRPHVPANPPATPPGRERGI